MTFPLKNLPEEVDKIVRDEQLRLELFDNLKLKKEEVYYRIVRDWDGKNSEAKLLDLVSQMCIQSLSPEVFEKWEDVYKQLVDNRKAFKK